MDGDVSSFDGRLAALQAREEARFVETHPGSRELAERAKAGLFEGVPMHWMRKWPGGFPVFVREAKGARFVDVDGNEYVDFCLGDTGAMTGHAPGPTLEAIAGQAARGITLMLPSEDALWVSQELTRRFRVTSWQFALTATDANRFSIRLARHLTGRSKILVFNWCYHGTVDETFATLEGGAVRARSGNLGPPVDPAETTRVVEFNDVLGLERELSHGDVALVLTEPALTNIGIVHPEPGFHDALRELTRRHGTLLAIDETHTICCGPGGFTGAHGLDPDIVTIGKPIAGGIPAAAYGFSEEVASRLAGTIGLEDVDVGGVGGTLAANALSLAAMRATLSEVLTDEAFERMVPLAVRWTEGVEAGIEEAGLPWHVTRLGCRAEYLFGPDRPHNGGEAHAAGDFALERYMHLHALNRGILLTPFHNMALMSPATAEADVDRHTEVFREAVLELGRVSVAQPGTATE
jgi:glutamate-1-semialdehyde 2,1-aminomutase